MRLLDAQTLCFCDFFDQNTPPYAILSHTWGPDEVSFQDALALTGARTAPISPDPATAEIARRAGWIKIVQTCELASRDGLRYVWVDTCCIDKTSSAELSEAINCMFGWYENAEVCYTYLADVPSRETWDLDSPGGSFENSRWFTRGWTLQELVAPSRLVFYATDWSRIATRHELAMAVSSLTGIHWSFLRDEDVKDGGDTSHAEEAQASQSTSPEQPRLWDLIDVAGALPARIRPRTRRSIAASLRSASIAERMSWAAKRQTTRVEDIAYCLLGIFGVHMPLIYGEGRQAFIRLQQEIMRQSDDMSILAWNLRFKGNQPLKPIRVQFSQFTAHPWKVYSYSPRYGRDCPSVGVLAESPASFLGCEDVIPSETDSGVPVSVSSKGLEVVLPLSDDEHPHFVLPCRHKNDLGHLICIPLVRRGPNTFARARFPARLVTYSTWYRWRSQRINLLMNVDEDDSRPKITEHSFWIKELPPGFHMVTVYPDATYFPSRNIVVPEGGPFSELPAGSCVSAAVCLSTTLGGEKKTLLIALYANKLYNKGFWWARPIRTSYKILPLQNGSTGSKDMATILSMVSDNEIPSEPLQYEIVGEGLLYVSVQPQLCQDKLLFVVKIKNESRSVQATRLRRIFDLKTCVLGYLREQAQRYRVTRVVISVSCRAVLFWEDVVNTLRLIVILMVAIFACWVTLFHSGPTGTWFDNRIFQLSGISWALALLFGLLGFSTHQSLPYLSLIFPKASSLIRRRRLLLTAALWTPVCVFLVLTRASNESLDLLISPLVPTLFFVLVGSFWVVAIIWNQGTVFS